MLTIVVPMAGSSAFYPETDQRYPKIFHEILGRPMTQVVIESLLSIRKEKRFVFIANDSDIKKYRLDNVLKMLTDNNCDIVIQKSETKGAVCSLLLAVKFLNHPGPILISNSDQVIEHDLNKIIDYFEKPGVDGGVVTFDSVHPQWSYARVTENQRLIETAEKAPISRNAIAGQYYFSHGSDFVESAMKTIVKDRSHAGKYYTSSVLNEMILDNRDLFVYPIDSCEYHSFYSPEKIRDFEQHKKGIF